MATPAVTRALWWGATLGSLAVLVALALHGERPEPGLARFKAAGIMRDLEPTRITELEVRAGGRRWRFTRERDQAWEVADASTAPPAGFGQALDRGLHFLQVSAPQRVLAPEELVGTADAELGLDPPRYTVRASDSAAPVTVDFGGLNHQGLAQYARVRGRPQVFLLPTFVGEPWRSATGLR